MVFHRFKIFSYALALSAASGMIVSCEAKPSKSGVTSGSQTTPATASPPSNLTNASDGPPQSSREHQGGDQLPVVVDPESPASCAVVAKGERCGDCCSDVFTEDSERWHQCMNACTKAEASNHEH